MDKNGKEIYLKDIWPTSQEIQQVMASTIKPSMFHEKYGQVFDGNQEWKNLPTSKGMNYAWSDSSTYIKNPPYFEKANTNIGNIKGARILAVFGDSITTDHISPAGSIAPNSPAAKYLNMLGVERKDFNSYGSRRGNHEVMMRGTFANPRIKNELLGGTEGGYTHYIGHKDTISLYDAALAYSAEEIPTVIFAGKEYGTGSSRDWAAKGTNLLGVKAIIAESFERIHRSNLVGMGVIPMVFQNGMTRGDLQLVGDEIVDISNLDKLEPHKKAKCRISRDGKVLHEFELLCKIDTEVEIEYLQDGGILQYVLKKLV